MIRIFYPQPIYKLLDALSKHKVYVVGGFVRDMLLQGHGGEFFSKGGGVIPEDRVSGLSGISGHLGELKNCVEQTGCFFSARYGLRSRSVTCSKHCVQEPVTTGMTHKCVSDIDLVTADPLELFLPTVQQLSSHAHVIQPYQAVQFSFEGYQVTLTRLRYDDVCKGRQAEVVFVNTLQEDVWRRDFTVNALYADAEGQVIDFVGGYQDLAQRKVCFIGDPETRIKEDALRVLRYVRFCSLLQTPMDLEILDLMQSYLPQLESIPQSRLQYEVKKIQRLPGGKENLEKLDLMHKHWGVSST